MALIDSGSDRSFINSAFAAYVIQKRIQPRAVFEHVTVANGGTAPITECFDLAITIAGREFRHEFQVLPALGNEMLIGVDLWARLGFHLPPPPPQKSSPRTRNFTISEGLTPRTEDETRRLEEFLHLELARFDGVTGPTNRVAHHLRLKDPQPIKQRYRPRNPAMQAVIDTAVDEMLREGVIEPSQSAWSSPVVIVKKKDGKPRFCIDFRRVNAVTERDVHPLPHISATLDKLRGAKYLTTLDLKSGYWQVPLTPESRPITAFTIPGRGLMQFRVMPFGLHSAPATFQRLLDTVLGPALEPHVFVYLDDIIIASPTFEDHLTHLAEVFRRLREAKLRLNPEKCHFCRTELKYLGHVITRKGIRTEQDKRRHTVARAHDRSESQAIFGNGILVPPLRKEFFRSLRTANTPDREKRTLAVGPSRKKRLPST